MSRHRHGHAVTGANTPEYKSWGGMKDRCSNVNNHAFARYGGRGIVVCGRWRDSFEAFLEDMGHKPTPEHSIDRIDNDGNYEPGNCRWATRKEQRANRRPMKHPGPKQPRARFLEVGGVRDTLSGWSRRSGISLSSILQRLRLGWDPKRVVSQPVRTFGDKQ